MATKKSFFSSKWRAGMWRATGRLTATDASESFFMLVQRSPTQVQTRRCVLARPVKWWSVTDGVNTGPSCSGLDVAPVWLKQMFAEVIDVGGDRAHTIIHVTGRLNDIYSDRCWCTLTVMTVSNQRCLTNLQTCGIWWCTSGKTVNFTKHWIRIYRGLQNRK